MKSFFLCLLLLSPITLAATVGIPKGLPKNAISIENGKVKGIFSKLITCMETRHDIRFEWNFYPTRRLIAMISDHQLDLIFPMGFDAQRTKVAVPSFPTLSDKDIWIFTDNPPDFSNKQLKIAVKMGSPQEDTLKARGYQNIYTVEYDTILSMIDVNRVSAALLPITLYADLSKGRRQYKTQMYLKREVGFYLSKSFAKTHLGSLNQAIKACL